MQKFILFFLAFSIFHLSQANATTVKVGNGGDYSCLKDAFLDINKGFLTGDIVIEITSNLTETSAAKLTASGVSNPGGTSNYATVTIYPTTTGIAISGNLPSANLIDLYGADNVTIDGRVNREGSTVSLIIENTGNTGASAVGLSYHAENNKVQFCTLKGFSTTARGIINLDNRSGGAGNGDSNNEFSNNIFRGNATGTPYYCIYSLGSSVAPTVNNTVLNNSFPDFLKAGASSAAVKIGADNSAWTISNNSFYHEAETFTATGTALVNYAISVISGNAYTIENNYIGGTAPHCGGIMLTKSATGDQTFAAIHLITTTGAATNVQGNVIRKIDWANSGKNTFYGILIETGATGDVNIGTVSGNKIGSNKDTNSLIYSAGTTGGNVYGIYANTTGTVVCNYNQIGAITANNSIGVTNVSAIYVGGLSGNTTVKSNTIGSENTPNSITTTAAVASESVYGINIQGNGINLVNSNVISNLSTGTTASGYAYGINISGGNTTANGNFIHSLDASPNSSTSSSSAILVGISSVKGTNLISNNIISIKSAFGAVIYGLYETTAATSTSIFHNTVSVSGVNPSIGAQKSYALNSGGTANIRDIRNNILVNTRTGGTGTKVSAVIAANVGGTLTVYFNNFIPSYTTLGTNSQSLSPGFTNASGISVADYNISATLLGDGGTGITTDFAGATRTSPKMGALEFAYILPSVTPSINTLSDFNYIAGNGPSATQSFTVSGANLQDNIRMAASPNFELSLDASSGFGSYLSVLPVAGSVSSTTIYVRLKDKLDAGTYATDSLVISTAGASERKITCSGSVSAIPPLVSASKNSLSQFSYAFNNGPSAATSFHINGTHLTNPITITPPANFEISESESSGYTSAPILVSGIIGTVVNKEIYVRLKSNLAVGNYSNENISITSQGSNVLSVVCNGIVGAGKTFTVTVPAGTNRVYIAGTFPLKNWDITAPYELTITANPQIFTGTFICDNTLTYKYLNETGDWDYQAGVSVGGAAESARTYATSDVVAAWLNVKQVKLNVSFAAGTGVPEQLFVLGSWDNNTVPLELVKTETGFTKILGGYAGDKFSGNTNYKYYTNAQASINWEANANGSVKANRTTTASEMNDVIDRFTTSVPIATTTDVWRVLPIRSQLEAARDSVGGEGEQIFHGFARCLNHPEYIYGAHDVMGSWRSIDGGTTWKKNLDKGSWLPFTSSIEVDPVNPNLVFMQTYRGWWYTAPTTKTPAYGYAGVLELEGLYRSVDGGTNWEQVLNAEHKDSYRAMRHLIAYSKPSMTTANTSPTRWYSSYDYNGLYRSDNSGNSGSWVKCAAIDTIINNVVPHPTLPDVVYVSTFSGLYKSVDAGATLVPDARFAGDKVTSVVINPQNPSIMYVVVYNDALLPGGSVPNPAYSRNGMYVSKDAGVSFTRPVFMHSTKAGLETTKECAQLYMNEGFPEQIYWVSGSNMGAMTKVSNDGGVSWSNSIAPAITFPGLARETGWRRNTAGRFASILPNPKDKYAPAIATGSSTITKIVNIDKSTPTAYESATGFTGNSSTSGSDAISFHPNNPNMMMFSCNDIGPRTSTTGGSWFHEPDPTIYKWWQQDLKIGWAGSYSADYQYATGGTASSNVVASVGMYNEKSQLMHSSDNGVTWDSCVTVLPWKTIAGTDSMEMRKNPITNQTYLQPVWDVDHYKQAFSFVGFDPQVGYENYCYSGTMMSTDGGYSFNHINFPIASYSGTITTRNSISDVLPTVMGISKDASGNSHVIALSAYKSSVWRSDDHGATWYPIMPKRSPSLKGFDRTMAFAVHPTDPNVFFCMNPSTRDLMKVVYNPATQTYTDVPLPIFGFFPSWIPANVKASNQIRFINVDPVDPNIIYVSMSVSGVPNVWRTTDAGTTWAALEGITCHSGAMKVNPHTRELYRGSMAGVWIYGTTPTLLTTNQQLNFDSNKLRIFVNRSSNSLRIFGAADNERFSIYDLSGRMLLQFVGESTSLKNLSSGAFILKSSQHAPIKFLK